MSAPRHLAGPRADGADALFFVDTASLSAGPQKQAFRLAQAWQKRGYRAVVAALRGDEVAARAQLERHGVPVYALSPHGAAAVKSFRLDSAWNARAFCRALRAPLVFTMESLVDYHVRLGLLGTSIPVVTMLAIGRWKWEERRHRVLVMRWLAGHRGCVTANARTGLEGWKRVLGPRRFARLATAVIPNAVDPDELVPRFARARDGALVIGGLGRFAPQKGFDLLLRAFARLPAAVDGRELRLSLKGRGPEEASLRALARELGIEARTDFLPFDAAVEAYLHGLTLLVVPSRWAGLENVALEGMLAGTPTLCSTLTGLDELPRDPCLELFPPTVEALQARLEGLVRASAAAREQLARAQRDFLVRELGLGRTAQRLEEFLERAGVLRPRPPAVAPERIAQG